MTDYCTVTDIEGWFPGVDFNAGTKLKETKVESMISKKSAYIDSRIGSVYETPITGTSSLLIVQEICEFLVIADVEYVLKTGLGRRGEGIKPIDYREIAMDRLDKLESGESALLDAASKGTDNFKSYNYENSVTTAFEKDEEQW